MKQDFLDYIRDEFDFSDSEISDFEGSLNTPLKKSIRVNTNKISVVDFKKLAKKNTWTLTETSLGNNIFYIDRPDTSIPLGHTPEHISGLFYVQELAASSSPFYMSEDKIDITPYLILDMSASPGGKTTQLTEYYPNSLIVANELDKTRLKGLFSNLDRMSSLNTVVSNYDGRFFKQVPEIFDKVLLDAPCSGEGTGYKTDDALKYWNIKNIKRIAKLQFGLLEAAIKATKPGGEIVYSTCTLNTIENEQIVAKIIKKYDEYIEVDKNYIRAWPHINKTGGFFVAKIKKIKSMKIEKESKLVNQNIGKISNKETRIIQEFFMSNFDYDISDKYLYRYHSDIMLCSQNIDNTWDILFFYKIGVNIGDFKDGVFYPNFFGGSIESFKKGTIALCEKDLDIVLKGYEIESKNTDGYYQIMSPNNLPLGLAKLQNNSLKSLLPTNMMRK
ncbi:NOL1/NOP2/sun family putative RNA methylase [Candidatus Gracilibacteria bacterium]|nr:NOL1/NOP2/sun family putative RNA methylase [Candidatus Gracilibacteria bacterium]